MVYDSNTVSISSQWRQTVVVFVFLLEHYTVIMTQLTLHVATHTLLLYSPSSSFPRRQNFSLSGPSSSYFSQLFAPSLLFFLLSLSRNQFFFFLNRFLFLQPKLTKASQGDSKLQNKKKFISFPPLLMLYKRALLPNIIICSVLQLNLVLVGDDTATPAFKLLVFNFRCIVFHLLQVHMESASFIQIGLQSCIEILQQNAQ